MFGDVWISVNDLVDWLFREGGGICDGWPTVKDMVQQAASKYSAYMGEPGVMMDKKTAAEKLQEPTLGDAPG